MSPKQVQLTSRDKRLIAHLEKSFPVVPRPFEVLGEEFDCDENTLIEWITDLVQAGYLKNFRPTLELEVKEE